MPLSAVLTGDIVNSTKLKAAEEKKLIKTLTTILQPYPFEFYRGDSFQVYLKDAAHALRIALLCRTAAIKLFQLRDIYESDIRISIGIGAVQKPVRSLGSAKGEAFVLSGRGFDELQKNETRLAIITEKNIATTGAAVIADYVNSLYKELTSKQAEVIFLMLQGENQQHIAETLNKSKSTINQFTISARWSEIERLLFHYEKLINELQ